MSLHVLVGSAVHRKIHSKAVLVAPQSSGLAQTGSVGDWNGSFARTGQLVEVV